MEEEAVGCGKGSQCYVCMGTNEEGRISGQLGLCGILLELRMDVRLGQLKIWSTVRGRSLSQ